MLTLNAFGWRRLTAESAIAYRLDERGVLRLLGTSDDVPPFTTVRLRSGAGYVERALSDLGLTWQHAEDGEGWVLRTQGAPRTMSHVEKRWNDAVQSASRAAGLDERLALVTMGAEAGDIAPDAEGYVKAPRTENGYPERTGERDPGDFARDAEDWRASGGRHSSHGLMQTLISTAYAARPDLFAGLDPSVFRTVLWVPENSIACGLAHAASFPTTIKADPVLFRVKYGSGGIRAVGTNVWGADLYDDSVLARFCALWNDDACVRAGTCAAPEAPTPRPAPSPSPSASGFVSAAWGFAAFSLFSLAVVAAFSASELARAARAVRERGLV